MTCCGRRRAALARPAVRAAAAPVPVAAARTGHELVYAGPVPAVLRGPGSGRLYRIDRTGPVGVDRADVPALLRTGWFVDQP